jgi:hypothetical protein
MKKFSKNNNIITSKNNFKKLINSKRIKNKNNNYNLYKNKMKNKMNKFYIKNK